MSLQLLLNISSKHSNEPQFCPLDTTLRCEVGIPSIRNLVPLDSSSVSVCRHVTGGDPYTHPRTLCATTSCIKLNMVVKYDNCNTLHYYSPKGCMIFSFILACYHYTYTFLPLCGKALLDQLIGKFWLQFSPHHLSS